MDKKYLYDVFLSHAVEDKIAIANDLWKRLKEAGVNVWYSGNDLKPGDSIEDAINEALDNSRYGVVIFSKNYIDKNWTMREYYRLLARETDENKLILPVHYNVTPHELAVKDLTMADRFAIRADKGLDYVVEKLLVVVSNRKPTALTIPRTPNRLVIYLIAAALFLGAISIPIFSSTWFKVIDNPPDRELVQQIIQERTDKLSGKINNSYIQDMIKSGAKASSISTLDSVYSAFKNQKSHYRNEYELYNGSRVVRARKNVEAALRIDVAALNPSNAYDMVKPLAYLTRRAAWAKYSMLNTQPLQSNLVDEKLLNDSTCIVSVQYKNNIRYLEVELSFNTSSNGVKRHQMFLVGFLPEETYVLRKRKGEWRFASLQ